MHQSSGRSTDRSRQGARRVERGFTVGELLMLASLLTFASTGFMTLVKHGRKGKVNPEQLAYQQLILQGRETVDRMVQEIGRAGTSAPEATADDLDANSANSNRIAAPQFLVATPTHVIFEADLDSDGSVERVEYRLNGETLERSAVLKFPEGGAPSPRYEAMVSSVDNGAMPLFSYVGDPFGPVPAQGDSGAVRILLLLRAPSKQNKQPYQTVGFEGIAHRQNAVAAHQSNPSERSSLLDETGSAPSFADDEMPIQETYARKWTLR